MLSRLFNTYKETWKEHLLPNLGLTMCTGPASYYLCMRVVKVLEDGESGKISEKEMKRELIAIGIVYAGLIGVTLPATIRFWKSWLNNWKKLG
jgi:hypothetical protein